jgi:hypothetical protein
LRQDRYGSQDTNQERQDKADHRIFSIKRAK